MNDIFLGNDYFISYFMGDRATGQSFSGLSLEAFLALNPTGSALTSSVLTGPTSSLVGVTFSTGSIIVVEFQTNIGTDIGSSTPMTQSYTQSIVFQSSQSITTSFSGSIPGVSLQIALTEYPPCSAEYVGTFNGADIATALSQSFSSSFATAFSSSVATGSFSGSFGSQSVSYFISQSFITMSVSGYTASLTSSNVLSLIDGPARNVGLYEVITSGTHISIVTPLILRTARFIP